jgi:ribose transport system ATP-binding protein
MDDPFVAALQVSRISKTFGGARALKDVDVTVRPGEVHGLLGQNGSGKSTLVKILSGFHSPDPGGSIAVHGRPLELPMRPGAFRAYGMAFVHQNLGLVPSLSVLENMRVASITAPAARIDWAAERRAAQAALDRFGIGLPLKARVGAISQIERALLAIVRASDDLRTADRGGKRGILILDEPTPFLPREGVGRLFALVRQVAAHGDSVIFISHDIDEVREITDRATILRDGSVSGTLITRDASHDDFVEGIVGRRITRAASVGPSHAGDAKAIIRNIAEPGLTVPEVAVGRGEILGLSGLIGSGYERLPYLVFGATPARSGTLDLEGISLPLSSMTPSKAVARGLALLPADRARASGIASLTVADNMMILDLARLVGALGLKRRQLARRVGEIAATYEVRPNNPGMRLGALSGGNAQKVLLAKWLIREPALLMLDEPTQGVDVGTRQQLFQVIRQAADQGAGVICASSDFEQLADLCTRVLVFARGRVAAELSRGEITKDSIARACYGQASRNAA